MMDDEENFPTKEEVVVRANEQTIEKQSDGHKKKQNGKQTYTKT